MPDTPGLTPNPEFEPADSPRSGHGKAAMIDEPSGRLIATSRHTSFYLEAGPRTGPAIVFVHGWPETSVTWRHQIDAFSRLGFRTIAPDNRGCGRSGSYENYADYAQREFVRDMIDLLDSLGISKAIWVGHDWGSAIVSNIVRHHTDRCLGAVAISQPFDTLERGLDFLIQLLNRKLYPVERFPAGQFEYISFYQESFDLTLKAFESDVSATLRAIMRRGDPTDAGSPFLTAFVRQQGGWFGPDGAPAPDLPLDTSIINESDLAALTEAYQHTGFFGANALYMNDADNRSFIEDTATQNVSIPSLFLYGTNDFVCDTVGSSLTAPMEQRWEDLTIRQIASGHWMPQEQPAAVNVALSDWILARLPYIWPAGTLR